jgi:hypothetical protein
VGIAVRSEGAQARGSCFGAPAFVVAARLVATLRRVETSEAVNGALKSHSVTVDDIDLTGLFRSGAQDLDIGLLNSWRAALPV